ncbi:MAG: AAA family ATPase [Candidatus Dormibacteria bacterium]
MTAGLDPSWAELEAAAAIGRVFARATPMGRSPQRAKSEMVWRTGADVGGQAESHVEWIWRDYLARGTVTELDGKIKVSGKTTFCMHLARAVLDGDQFLDRATLRGAVVYITEEGTATFERGLVSRGLSGTRDLHFLSRRAVAKLPWDHVVGLAEAKVRETAAVLLVVDTFSRVAGLRDDDENSAGKAMAAMTPLMSLATSLNIAVLITRHERRAGGSVGESARGSTAISGDVDQILQLGRTGGYGHQNERWLRAVGRYDETPPELRIALHEGRYRVVGCQDGQLRAAEAILARLQPDQPVSVVELAQELGADGHSRTSTYAAVRGLIADGKADRVDQIGRSGHSRKAIVSRSSFAREHLLADLGQDGGSALAGERPRSEGNGFTRASLSLERPAARPLPTLRGNAAEEVPDGEER